jgi:hypothetical protein
MNRTFIFTLSKDFKESISPHDFIQTVALRMFSVIFFKGDTESEEEVEVSKFIEMQNYITNLLEEKTPEIMEDGSLVFQFDIDDALFI